MPIERPRNIRYPSEQVVASVIDAVKSKYDIWEGYFSLKDFSLRLLSQGYSPVGCRCVIDKNSAAIMTDHGLGIPDEGEYVIIGLPFKKKLEDRTLNFIKIRKAEDKRKKYIVYSDTWSFLPAFKR